MVERAYSICRLLYMLTESHSHIGSLLVQQGAGVWRNLQHGYYSDEN